MKILAIETSCDETVIALVEARGGLQNPRFKILKNLVASQIKIHQPFGGIVPNLAKREHLRNLPILLNRLIKTNPSKSKIKNPRLPSPNGEVIGGQEKSKIQIKIQKFLKTIDIIAVTVGPGLEPCLWTGINFAKELKAKSSLPLRQGFDEQAKLKAKIIGINHLEGHLYSNWLSQSYETKSRKIEFPAIALIISGGHTILLLIKDLTHWKKLGETRDDAVGEAFDKVARMLKLPYPGGPEIEKLAKLGNSEIEFPKPMLNQKNYDFSFSGLKTSVLYYLKQFNNKTIEQLKPDIAASFQQAAFDVLISKTIRAAKEFSAKGGSAFGGKVKSILISGGVAVNKTLQKQFKREIEKQNLCFIFHAPSFKFCGDNAAMIAAAGYINFLQKKKHQITAQSNLNL